MVAHEMTATDAVAVLEALTAVGADPCAGGGWAVDALLGEQTRKHADLDLWLLAGDLEPAIATFVKIDPADNDFGRAATWRADKSPCTMWK